MCRPKLLVHTVYMGKKRDKPLAWRPSHIRQWREYRDLTLQEVVDLLRERVPPIETTYTSLSRVERGAQLPKINMIEAIAEILKTDVDSMLNHPPGGDELRPIWQRAKPDERIQILKVAKALVGPE